MHDFDATIHACLVMGYEDIGSNLLAEEAVSSCTTVVTIHSTIFMCYTNEQLSGHGARSIDRGSDSATSAARKQ